MKPAYENIKQILKPVEWTGDLLREMRLKMNLTQKDVAELLGISACTISHIETGKFYYPVHMYAYGTLLERYYAYCKRASPTFWDPLTEEVKNLYADICETGWAVANEKAMKKERRKSA